MAYEQRPGDISIFQEKQKTNERAPDWKGSLVIPPDARPGDKLNVAVWYKSDTMLAGKVEVPRQRQEQPSANERFPDRSASRFSGGGGDPGRQAPSSELDDEIPF